MNDRARLRVKMVQLVLLVYALGHLATATMFIFWPGYFIDARAPHPFWPLSSLQFGVWPPLHQGFMNVIAVYDVAIAVVLVLTAMDPVQHRIFVFFSALLWALHGAVHAYHVVWGSAPAGYWFVVTELWIGTLLLAVLYPRARARA